MDVYFSNNCEALRKSKGWKQSEIEGFSVSTWSNYENGRSVPGFDDLIKISKLFAVSIDDLLFADLSKSFPQNKSKSHSRGGKKYLPTESQDNLSVVQDSGKDRDKQKDKPLVQRIQGLENRLAKLEKLVKKIVDKLN